MLTAIASTLLLCGASLVVGLALLQASRFTVAPAAAPAVGFAALLFLSDLTFQLGATGTAAAIVLAVALIAAVVALVRARGDWPWRRPAAVWIGAAVPPA